MLVHKFQITIAQTGERFTCRADQHLLAGMISTGKKGIPSGCHGGGCGICKVRVLEGRIKTLPMSRQHVSKEQEGEGFALACRVFPRSALRLDVIGKMAKTVLRPQAKKKYGFV